MQEQTTSSWFLLEMDFPELVNNTRVAAKSCVHLLDEKQKSGPRRPLGENCPELFWRRSCASAAAFLAFFAAFFAVALRFGCLAACRGGGVVLGGATGGLRQ